MEALTGRFTEHHAFLAQLHLDLIDQHTRAVDDLTTRIEVVIEPFRPVRELLTQHSRGQHHGRRGDHRRDRCRHDPVPHRRAPGVYPYLKGALGIAGMSAARSKDTYLSTKYRRIATRRGPLKALVPVEHAILTATWHMITNGTLYNDPSADFYTRRDPDKTRQRAIDQLNKIGYTVTLTPTQTAGHG